MLGQPFQRVKRFFESFGTFEDRYWPVTRDRVEDVAPLWGNEFCSGYQQIAA